MLMEQTKVHRIRFYVPDNLRGINCMSIDVDNEKLAIARRGFEDGTAPATVIEIWDIKHSPCIEQQIHEDDDEPTLVESLCWGVNLRLFSCGYDGYVSEYDLTKDGFKQRYDISGGPLWCLAINPSCSKLVCGSEDGSVSIVDLVEDGFGEVRRLGKMSTRVLSLAWMKNGDKIIAGSQGIISIFDHKTRRLLEKIELDNDCLIWSLSAFEDNIISGDSKGYTSFWAANTGTLVKRHHSHRSDVLTVFASPRGPVYSAGIDPVIAQFDAWTSKPLIPINAHTHDVKAIVVDRDGQIYSGGQDVDLVRTSIRPKTVTRLTPDLNECIKFCGDTLAVQYLKAIELFNIDTKVSDQADTSPVKLATIRSKHNIIASALSTDWVVYGGFKNIVFINLENELDKVPHTFSLTETVNKMSFLDKSTLAICSATKVHLVTLVDKTVKEVGVHEFNHRITLMSACPNSIAIALSNNELIFLPKGCQTPISVSKVHSIPTAMNFNAYESNKLYICTSNKMFSKYNLEQHSLKMDVSTNLSKLEAGQYFKGITFTSNSVLLYTNAGLCSLDPKSFSFKTGVSNYKSIISIHSTFDLKHPQIVLVELPDEEVIKLLPPAFMRRIFGAE